MLFISQKKRLRRGKLSTYDNHIQSETQKHIYKLKKISIWLTILSIWRLLWVNNFEDFIP